VGDSLSFEVQIFKDKTFSSSSEHHSVDFGSTSDGSDGYQLIPFLLETRASWLCASVYSAFFLLLLKKKKSPIREDHLFFKTLSLKLTAVVTLECCHICSDTELCLANLLFKISPQISEVASVRADNRLHISSSSHRSTRDRGRPRSLPLRSPRICPRRIEHIVTCSFDSSQLPECFYLLSCLLVLTFFFLKLKEGEDA